MNHILPHISVAVQIDLPDDVDGLTDLDRLEDAVRHGLAQVLLPDASGQVSLLLTGDETVRELNREFRGVDRTTDVLSFSAEHGGHWMGDDHPPDAGDDWPADFPLPEGEAPPIGDIVVSVPQTVRQAEAHGVPLEREIALLVVHGALHLLGYDHYGDEERTAMQALERAALAAIFPGSEPADQPAP